MRNHSDRGNSCRSATALRILCRLLWLTAAVAAGTAITITVLKAMANDPTELPASGSIVLLGAYAVVAFVVAMLLMIVADRVAAHAERRAVAQLPLTPEEREAEKLRETPLLARQHRQQEQSPFERDEPKHP